MRERWNMTLKREATLSEVAEEEVRETSSALWGCCVSSTCLTRLCSCDRKIWARCARCSPFCQSMSVLCPNAIAGTWKTAFVQLNVLVCSIACIVWWQQSSTCPVLKHGPRSLTCTRVDGWQTGYAELMCWLGFFALATNHLTVRGLSMNVAVRTRKMVNYACEGQAQGKLWWKPAMILTCKLFVVHGYRGARPIESSSSWFPLKFPSGQLEQNSFLR